MARFFCFFTLAFALLMSCVMAGEQSKRQIGNLQCNIARLKTVAGLAKSASAIKKAMTAAQGDAETTAQLQTAAQGVSSAQAGVGTIAKALITGQLAPAAARQQVADGLNAATTALGSTTSSDPNVDSAIASATSAIAGTTTSGQQVVANCK
ncbi:hypothetical protein JR316_0002756 [Psilocybe cubensis]|uniref:Uncharacterized protein n=1 Tax=Psilocybe cubensis TaxID=181762 RepID=A0ACB8HD40_PSICU|nr:hypothetical protein JR316_0002756 [Psilocybe cubensis]KAH9485841.1 hypothetical protein JR316_0002756 [Psilocybe cubensis]